MYDRFKAKCYWYDKVTGKRGVYLDNHDTIWQDNDEFGTFNTYMWDDGNYACDCNRGIFFIKDHSLACGNTRFIIEKVEVIHNDGTVLKTFDPFEKE